MNTKAQSWLDQVANLADQYTNVQIAVLVFINMSDPAQVSEFTSFANSLTPYSSIYGFEFEREYYGDTVAINQQFCNIVQAANKVCIIDPLMESNFAGPVLDYSTYPYYGGTIPSSLPAGSRSLGIGYGETGGCPSSTSSCADGMPVVSTYGLWTQSVVTSIVNTSPDAPYTFLYSDLGTGTNQYAGKDSLWNNPTLRNWIWSDSYYQSDYLLSNTNVCYTCTTVTTTQNAQTSSSSQSTTSQSTTSQSTTSQSTTSQSTTSQSTTSATNTASTTTIQSTTSTSSSSDPSCVLSNSDPSVGSWLSVKCSGFPSNSSVEVTVFDNDSNSYVAYLYPGSTSSSGTLSFSMQVTSAMVGTDNAFFYSTDTSNNPLADVIFVVKSTTTTSTISTTTSATTTTTTTNMTNSSSTTVSAGITTSSFTTSTVSYTSFPTTTTATSTTSSTTTTSLASQSTISSVSKIFSSTFSVSSSTQKGHNGQGSVQSTLQGNGQTNIHGNQKKTTSTISSTNSSVYSASSLSQGISSLFSPSAIFSLFSSSNNPAAAYGITAYESTLMGGLALFLGILRKSRRNDVPDIHAWRW